MKGNTERFHRVLLLWLELSKFMGEANAAAHSRNALPDSPWNCDAVPVRDVWRRLTHPDNRFALEQWLCQAAEGEWAEWARKALEVCRDRARATRPGN